MRILKYILSFTIALLFTLSICAEDSSGLQKRKKTSSKATGCEPAKSSTELYVNNVRTLIHTGGDMWWDLKSLPRYEVPAGSGRHLATAGAIWIGGKDNNGQLKLAAQMFRQNGNDYWSGPLIMSGENQASTSKEICRQFDRHFVITKEMVKEFRDWYACSKNPNCDVNKEFPYYTIPDIIMNWPAHGPAGGYDYYLAPFWDADNDGKYDPLKGDFPYFEFINEGITDDPDCLRPRNRMPKLFGDKTLWWVFNDAGNTHTETGATAIGLEIRAQAFAFSTNDEINDMTFYNYNIINRSTYTLHDTYIGIWTDADIGNPNDDYFGCDVERGLGYA
ncbi:MAG: T9SS C-terminal target domain-containing protein, partial [Bacteroidales bacterium]|nr:T9SS C-terminal target domain-containing protein [Bacteroidales bacterium]